MLSPRKSLAAACIVMVFLVHTLWFSWLFGWQAVDDAYISFRYAANLANGHGLVFNPGERVEGYSNFLWTLLMAPAAAGTGDPTRPSQVLGILFALVALGLAMDAPRRLFHLDAPWHRAGVGFGIAATAYFAAWAAAGLESGLYAALLMAFWYRHASEVGGASRFPAAALLCAALALTRPEGSFVAGAAILGHAWHAVRATDTVQRRKSWMFVGVLLGILVPYHLWRFGYYGPHWLPNSVHAKVGFTVAQAEQGALYVLRNFLLPYAPFVATLAVGRKRWRQLPFWSGQCLVWGHLAVIAAVGGDWSTGRYFAPLMPLVITLFVVAASDALMALRFGGRTRARTAAITLLVAWSAGAWYWAGWRHEAFLRRDFLTTDRERMQIGRWLAAKMPAETRIAVYAAGQLAFYSRLYTHDMLGINDTHIARVAVQDMGRGLSGHERFDASYTLDTVRPDVIVDGHRISGMPRHPTYGGSYVRVPVWTICHVAIRRDVLAGIVRARGAAFLTDEE